MKNLRLQAKSIFCVFSFPLAVSCGIDEPQTPQRQILNESEAVTLKAQTQNPTSSDLEKNMEVYLTQTILEQTEVTDGDHYVIQLATQTDVDMLNRTFACKTKVGQPQPPSADSRMTELADRLAAEANGFALENFSLTVDLQNSQGSALKRVVLFSHLDEESCTLPQDALTLYNSERFLAEQIVFVPFDTTLSLEQTVSLALDNLRAAVNRGPLAVNARDEASFIHSYDFAASQQLLDSFASVLVTFDDQHLSSLAPVQLEISELVPGRNEPALLEGLERIVAITLSVTEQHAGNPQPTPPPAGAGPAAPLSGLFSWFRTLISSSQTNPQNPGAPSPLPIALGLLLQNPQLALAKTLLDLFLGQALPVTPTGPSPQNPAPARVLPNYAEVLSLTSELKLGDQLEIFRKNTDYILTHFDGKIEKSLLSLLSLAHSQAFQQRLLALEESSTP